MARTRSPYLLLLALGAYAPVSLAGSQSETILKLLAEDRYDDALKKCEKWEASSDTAIGALRNACADAYWPLAEAKNTVQGWASYRETWIGTEAIPEALEREAAAVLRTIDTGLPEVLLLDMAELYKGTKAESQLRTLAADAAVRDANEPAKAAKAAQRYPDHAGLTRLVEKFPQAFVRVEIDEQNVSITLDPPVALHPEFQPRHSWGARDKSYQVTDWFEAIRPILIDHGVAESDIDALPEPEDGSPRVPLCWSPGYPEGWTPAVVISIGTGKVSQAVPFESRCSPTTWPTFLIFDSDRPTAISLAPGHLVDLRWPAEDETATAFGTLLPRPTSPVLLDASHLYQLLGDAWVVHPLSGGSPWLSTTGPSDPVELGSTLKDVGAPAGWRLVSDANGVEVHANELAELETPWRMVHGDIRFISPLVQQVLGLHSGGAAPPRAPAPSLEETLTRRQDPDPRAALQAAPEQPVGLSSDAMAELVANFEQLGLDSEAYRIRAGWTVDLDGDQQPESVLWASLGEASAILVQDGQERVFLFDDIATRMKYPPSLVLLEEQTYLVWSEAGDKATTRLVALRTDSTGFTVESLPLPLSTPEP